MAGVSGRCSLQLSRGPQVVSGVLMILASEDGTVKPG